jgi:2-polyprenyl-3-methyl-5-hydroxy-6-metoxy-1,4-benzoquinol methylase
VNKYDVAVDPGASNNAHAFMLEMVGWNRRVLELGAAAGHMTRALVAQNCRITTVEHDEDAARQLKSIADEVIVGDLNDPTIFDDVKPVFDVLLAGDVLEHLIDPQDVLNRAIQLVKSGGLIVLSIPNVAHADVRLSLLLGKWNYRPWGLLDDGHLRFFTLDNIKNMVRNAGLVITEMRRVHVPAFESELAPERTAFPTSVLDLIFGDSEAETYQFVLSATVYNGEYQLGHLSDRVLELERDVERLEVTNQALWAAQHPPQLVGGVVPSFEDTAGLRDEIEGLNSDIESLQQKVEEAESANGVLVAQLNTLMQTKTFRYTRKMRHVYGRLLRS